MRHLQAGGIEVSGFSFGKKMGRKEYWLTEDCLQVNTLQGDFSVSGVLRPCVSALVFPLLF